MFRFICIASLSLTVKLLTTNKTITLLPEKNGTADTYGISGLPILNWQEAMQHCKDIGKKLPSIIGLEEETTLISRRNQLEVTSIWLGIFLKDLLEWTWIGETGEAKGPVNRNSILRLGNGAQCCSIRKNGLYNTPCSSEVDGYICNSECNDCKGHDCAEVEGRCYNLKCHNHTDWYSAFMKCRGQRSGLATEIDGVSLPSRCSDKDLWVGCIKDQWLTAEDKGSVVLRFNWRPGERDDSKRCAVIKTDSSTPSWETVDCDSKHTVLCVNHFNEIAEGTPVDNDVFYEWVIIVIGIVVAVVMVVVVRISVGIWRKNRTDKSDYVDAASLRAMHHAGVASSPPSTPSGQPPPYPSKSDIASTASCSTMFDSCLECGQNDDNDSIHYDNMVIGDVTRCKSCGRPVAPDRPPPRIPRRVGKPSITGLQTRTLPLPGAEEDYENPFGYGKMAHESGNHGEPGSVDQISQISVTERRRASTSNAILSATWSDSE